MCLSKAYKEDNGEEAIVEDVASVEVEGDNLIFSTIMGEERKVEGKISKVDFSKNQIHIQTN